MIHCCELSLCSTVQLLDHPAITPLCLSLCLSVCLSVVIVLVTDISGDLVCQFSVHDSYVGVVCDDVIQSVSLSLS